MRQSLIVAFALGGAIISAFISGCGMAASPQPPSLQLPQPIHDLTAFRSGNRVTLNWTTPDETTDKLKLRHPVSMQICREEKTGDCQKIAVISVAPGQPAEYTDALSGSLSSGPLRPITYQIIGLNKCARSAGASNPALALAGEAAPRIENLSATMGARGVLLRWQKAANSQPGTVIYLQRTLLTTPSSSQSHAGIPGVAEPIKQTLEVPPNSDGANTDMVLDSSVTLNRKYRYVVFRIVQQKSGNQLLRAESLPSEPILINTRDTFPPAPPTGLAAVPVPAALNNGAPEIDLSWSPNTEPDMAQYLVFRENATVADAQFVQIGPISPDQPIIAPAFRDLNVHSGDTYIYYVIAVDTSGNRSAKSSNVTTVVSVP